MSALVHSGLRYRSPDDLAAIVCPHLLAALDRGHAVYAIVDAHAEAALRSQLGPAARRVRFELVSPGHGMSPEAFLAKLRAWADPAGRALVVGQYSAVQASPDECAAREDGVNLMLDDLPLTLLCACSDTDGAAAVATARRSHPGWISSGAASGNPDFRPPADRCWTPPHLWGEPVLTTTFRGLADLARLRRRVTGLLHDMGLRGRDVDAAVLAVHEAAVLACVDQDGAGASADPEAAERTLEVRATGTSLFCQVLAPGPAGPDRHADAHSVLASPVSDSDVLRPLTWFCRRVSLGDHARTRTIRVLLDRHWSAAPPTPVA